MRNVKKVLALLLAVLMLISLAGCDRPNDPVPGTADPAESTKQTTSPTTAPAAPEETTSPTTETTEPKDGLTVHENTFFTARYNEADGWTLAEEDFEIYEGGGDAYLRILNEDGNTGLLVHIEAYEESASSFRETLHANGVDLKAYVEGTWVTENIGGLQMAAVDKEDGEWYFFGRNEEAGVSYTVHVTDWDDPNVPELIENITFTASGTDNIDPPWPWEGEPYAVEPGEEVVGAFTLNSVQIPFADSIVTYETFDHNMAVAGNLVYIVSDGGLYLYNYDGNRLTLVQDMSFGEEYAIADVSAGNIWFSAFMENLLCFDGQQYTAAFEGTDYVSMCPSAPWGISWFSNSTIMKMDFDGASVSAYEYTLAEVDMISHLCIDANGNIFVCGSSMSDGEHRVFVYNENMELQVVLADEDGAGLGSAVFATQTANGFLVLDGNMRDVILYGADGSYIGCCDFSDLFGTDYPWPCDACVAEDGSIWVIMTDERADESADEVLVFKLSGF